MPQHFTTHQILKPPSSLDNIANIQKTTLSLNTKAITFNIYPNKRIQETFFATSRGLWDLSS